MSKIYSLQYDEMQLLISSTRLRGEMGHEILVIVFLKRLRKEVQLLFFFFSCIFLVGYLGKWTICHIWYHISDCGLSNSNMKKRRSFIHAVKSASFMCNLEDNAS